MTTKRVGNARLLRVAALLRSLPRRRFNYRLWVGYDWKGAPDLSCGTTACALGWATTIPSLRRAGLELKLTSSGFGEIRFNHRAGPIPAATKVFGLSWDDAWDLFIPKDNEMSATPKQVAAKIEKFVATHA